MTLYSEIALDHLKTIKPRDGWAIDKSSKGVRLLRRNVPLSNTYFHDLYYDSSSKTVVGILTTSTTPVRGQVLVESTGTPSTGTKIVNVSSWKKGSPAASVARSSLSGSNNNENNNDDMLSPEQSTELLKYFLMFVAATIIVKVVFSAVFLFYLIALPLLYLYAVPQCPRPDSFDAKRELKRVMRGHHLPDTHPDKPKGWLEGVTARVIATVVTEAATMPGYEVSMMNLGNAAIFATVRVPTAKLECYWVGALGKWHYVYQREIEQS